jgi:hypothetical protein
MIGKAQIARPDDRSDGLRQAMQGSQRRKIFTGTIFYTIVDAEL